MLSAPAFFSGTYDEALDLARRARDYLAQRGEREAAALGAHAVLSFARESLRLTSRVTRMMAWLLAQRAMHRGEMSREEALDDGFRLDRTPLCFQRGDNEGELPAALRALLDESERLYRRLARLDAMMRGVPAPI